MSNDMLGSVVRKLVMLPVEILGTIYDLLEKLAGKNGEKWFSDLKKFLRGEIITKVVSFITHTFTVMSDEAHPVEDTVIIGKFDVNNNDINSENFPLAKDGKWTRKEISIFHFGKTMSSEEVIAEMDKEGYKPATIWDLLGLAIRKPDLQRKFSIVALGSVCKDCVGDRDVPCLYEDSGDRRLSLRHFHGDWVDDYRFAGVRK